MRYWLVLCYETSDRAGEAFESFREAGLPVLMFESLLFVDVRCVATYGTDEEFELVEYPTSDDSYAGQVRVFELFETGLLVDVANMGTRDVDEVVARVAAMEDDPVFE